MLRVHATEDVLPSPVGSSSNVPKIRREIPRRGQGSSYHDQSIEEDTITIDEDAILTSAVFGSSFVHAVQVLDMTGEHVILFVFAVSLKYAPFS